MIPGGWLQVIIGLYMIERGYRVSFDCNYRFSLKGKGVLRYTWVRLRIAGGPWVVTLDNHWIDDRIQGFR